MSTRISSIGFDTNGVGRSVVTVGISLEFNNGNGAGGLEQHSIQGERSPCQVEEIIFVAGDNTVTIPDQAGGLIVVPAETNTDNILVKGDAADTGIAMHETAPLIFPFLAGNAPTLILHWLGVQIYEQEPVVLTNATDLVTLAAHGLSAGMRVQLLGSTTLPAELDAETWYYVITATANTFQLSLTEGGDPIDFTSDGTGVQITTSQRAILVWI